MPLQQTRIPSLVDHHQYIFIFAHLYNIVKQLGLTDLPWPKMDRVIATRSGAILAGVLSTTGKECPAE